MQRETHEVVGVPVFCFLVEAAPSHLSGFKVWGLGGVGVWGLGIGVRGLGFRV